IVRLVEAAERFELCVGCASLAHHTGVRFERLVYSALEEAFKDSLEHRQREQRREAVRLERVLRRGAVCAVYQPVVDTVERRTIGFEALTRVANRSFEGADSLFKVAHENRAIWRLERLCRSRAIRGARGLRAGQLLFLNVEPESFHDPELRAESTFRMLRSSGIAPAQIVLEITEHSAVRDLAAFRQVVDYFKFLGFRLAVDDVGSGYSGLSSIAELRPDFIKIDMALIRGIDQHPIKQDLTGTIARFSRRSGITLIAEGVETAEEMRCLKGIGVRYEQGHLFARPGPPFPTVPQRAFD
ncbi:MAG: EAL domain-containing protein, partial [Acidobacteriota bacterium]